VILATVLSVTPSFLDISVAYQAIGAEKDVPLESNKDFACIMGRFFELFFFLFDNLRHAFLQRLPEDIFFDIPFWIDGVSGIRRRRNFFAVSIQQSN
jgi:hypothetical protein